MQIQGKNSILFSSGILPLPTESHLIELGRKLKLVAIQPSHSTIFHWLKLYLLLRSLKICHRDNSSDCRYPKPYLQRPLGDTKTS